MTRFAKLFTLTFVLVLACGVFLRGSLPQVSTGTFQSGAEMSEARSGGAAVTLDDGRVLVFGGSTASGASNAVQVFDPASNSWSDLGVVMLDARSGHSATALADGRILLAGGENSSGPLSSLEIYDPASNSFASAGTLSGARTSHGAARLPDGRVLIIGGSDGSNALASSEIYDPESASASAGPSMSAPRSGSSVTRLLDGKVLIAGGNNGEADLASTEIYNPADGSMSAGANLSSPRSGHTAILLPNNNSVLIAGGSSAGSDLSSAELYVPWTSSVSSTGSMSVARSGAAGSGLKQDGIAVVAGGSGSQSSELYGFATVKTDKDDYAPGEYAQVSGSGWQPGETVALTFHEDLDTTFHDDVVQNVMADASGSISSQYLLEAHDVGVRYYLTAVGTSAQAQTTFTDALKIGVSRDTPPGAVINNIPSGSTFSVKFNIANQNNAAQAGVNLDGSYTLTLTGGLTVSSGPAASGTFSGLTGSTPLGLTWVIQAPTGPASGTITLAASITSPTCNPTSPGAQCSSSAAYTANVLAPTDSTPPTINCTVPDQSIWYADDVTVNCTASDSGSGLANPSDASFSLSTSVPAGTENAAASTGSHEVCDNAGNCATAGPYTFMVDKKAPQLSSCDTADGLWHATNVTLACHYTDGGSGPATQDVSLTTNVADGVETANAAASAGGAQACDNVGNCAASPADILGNMIDRKAPVITITTPPEGAVYTLNAMVPADYDCTDGGSGVATCTGTVADGSNINTSSVGAKSFTVNATDDVANSSSLTHNYSVQFGVCLLYDPAKAHKKGSTAPIKLYLCDASGNDVSSPSIVLHATGLVKTDNNASATVEDSGNANPDSDFRFDITLGPSGGYIFNLSTKNLSTGTWKLSFMATGDPVTHYVLFDVR